MKKHAGLVSAVGLLLLGVLGCGGDPGTAGEADSAAADPVPGAEVLGVWRLLESSSEWAEVEDAWVEITPTAWVAAAEGRLQYRAPLHELGDDEVVISLFANRQRRRLELDGDDLTVRFETTVTKFNPEAKQIVERYRRAQSRPGSLSIEALPLGEPGELSAERIAAIQAELAERARVDQEVREVFATAGAQPSPEDQKRMREVDEDNTDYLVALLAEVGHIDAARFGRDAANDAWLIVQHSPDLRLKWTVLADLERRREETGEADGNFALLWDRTRIWMGEKQRYGSQLFFGPDGMFLPPLEDPDRVDELRAEVGLGPLEEYRERFRERNAGVLPPVLDAY